MPDVVPESLPFDEAVEFFRRKLDLPTRRWIDLVGEAHDRAFVVAGAVQVELLADLRRAVDRAIANGTTLQDFRKDFDAAVAKAGWAYKGSRGWRTKVIYRTNLRTSHAAGRYAQMTSAAVVSRRPLWRYRHGGAVEPRPKHVAGPPSGWNGLVLRHDEPFWTTHYPPNGWGCSCFVQTLSEADLDRLGIEVGEAPEVGTYEHVDRQTGEVHDVPVGIDFGWDYAPGRSVAAGLGRSAATAAEAGAAVDVGVAREYVRSVVGTDYFARWLRDPVGHVPVAVLDDDVATAIGAVPRVVRLSEETMRKQARRHGELDVAEYRRLVDVVADGAVVQDGPQTVVVVRREGRLYKAVVKATATGRALFLTSFHRIRQSELARLLGAGSVIRPWQE